MDAETVAYVAGILDGEGCISLARRKGIYVTPTLQVANTDGDFIRWLADVTNCGGVYAHSRNRHNRKPCYLWSCAGEAARSVIRATRPHLRIKGAQADIVLGLVSEYEIRPDSLGRPSKRLTTDSFERIEAAVAEIRKLNHRGLA